MSQEFQQPQTPFNNQNQPNIEPDGQLSLETLHEIKSVQNLTTIATIAAPVSLFIGGVLLSGVSIICALVAYMKLKKVMPGNGMQHPLVSKVVRSIVLAACFGIGALVLNGISVAMVMPMMMDYLNTGDMSALNGLYGTEALPNQPSEVWG